MRTDEEVVIVVSRPKPDFLVLLRSPEKLGYWHLVAGGLETGESPRETAVRELEEETGPRAAASIEALPLELGYQRPPELGGARVTVHPFWVEAESGSGAGPERGARRVPLVRRGPRGRAPRIPGAAHRPPARGDRLGVRA